jgi:outer membrane receptor protein involved in Fe transport
VLEIGDVVIEPVPPHADRINAQVEQHAGLVTLGRTFGERVHWSVRDQLVYVSRGQPGLDAGSVGEAGQRPNAHERTTRNVLGSTLDASGVGPLALDATLDLWHRTERTHFRDPDVVPSVGATIDTDDRNDEVGTRLVLERELALGPARHRPSLAVELRRDWLRSSEFDDQHRNALGVVTQEDARLFGEWLRLVPALRFDRTEGFDAEWLPRLGAIVEPVRWLHLKGNAERSFRVPNFDELYFPDRGFLRGNPALEPEEAWNFDVGVELGLETLGPLEDLYFEAAYFHNDVRDSIVWLLVSPSLVEPRNTGDATLRGFEIGGGFGVLDWVGVSANYTHLDADLDASDTPLPGRADDEVSVRVELGPPSRLVRLMGQMLYTSEIPVSDSGNTILPSRTVFDAALTVDLVRLAFVASHVPLDSLLVTVEGKNLTDRAVRDAQFFPQPGRSVGFAVEARW